LFVTSQCEKSKHRCKGNKRKNQKPPKPPPPTRKVETNLHLLLLRGRQRYYSKVVAFTISSIIMKLTKSYCCLCLVSLVAVLALSSMPSSADALAFGSKTASKPTIKQSALPTFNKKTQRWEPGKDAEEGYDVIGTLLRNGPVPTFTRLTNPDDYQQAVYKFQAKEKCDINTAQGNMDAYFENPNDWYVPNVAFVRSF
jgi:hypothetical protein